MAKTALITPSANLFASPPYPCTFRTFLREPRRVLNLVYEWYDQHKEELKENWLRMEKGEEIINIKPLD